MIAVDDIGKYVARGALSRGLGRNISYVQIPISEVRKNSDDFATRLVEWAGRQRQ